MGIINALTGSLEGALADSWLETITCREYSSGQLVSIGYALHSARSSNTSGNPEVITDGSKIFVSYSETVLTVENGTITNIYTTPGEHKFHSELSKGFFSGKSITEGLHNVNEDTKERFTFGGDKSVVQRVYYINQREVPGNHFATPAAIPIRITVPDINFDVDCTCTLAGKYSFKIVDAVAFYKNFVGNIAKSFYADSIIPLINSFILTSIQPVMSRLFKEGTRPSAMLEYVDALAAAICEETTKKLGPERGLEIISCGIESFTLEGQDLYLLQQFERDKVLKNPTMAAAHLVGATADAMQTIAFNANAGKGYDRIGVALRQKRLEEGYVEPPKKPRAWKCKCGKWASGKFCTECGQKELFVCDECGAEGSGKFCALCGKPIKRY